MMTLDYAVKMLTVHERRKCGIPVIINGETGVGKTFLLEMLSILWNHSVVTALNKARSSLWNMLEVRLQHMCAFGKDEFESVRLNSPEEWFGLAKYPVGKVLYTDDDIIEIKKLQVALKESMANIPFDSLLHILNLPDPHEPIYRLYQQFCTHLLEKQYDPLFSMIVFPQDMTGDNNIMRLFEQANSKSPPVVSSSCCTIVAKFCGACLYHMILTHTFYRFSLPQQNYCMVCLLGSLRKYFINYAFMLVSYLSTYRMTEHMWKY